MQRIIAIAAATFLLLLPVVLVSAWTRAAEARLAQAEAEEAEAPQVAVAAQANEAYCTPALKKILRRVLQSCGLLQAGGRGCQPADARSVATMSGDDFNALFMPMQKRGGIVQYEKASAELDTQDHGLVDRLFADRRGASYFLVVSRASPEGSEQTNRELSRARAESVLAHLDETFEDPELQQQVGLLWLGEEFAQLDPSFCDWKRSGGEQSCTPEDLNRSAFVTWIDCTL
ncbi:MAG: hypothetical protein OEZ06_27675 [Myxococcales bacterium]|nr:hypothetical protein [Myxococcales bacterium]